MIHQLFEAGRLRTLSSCFRFLPREKLKVMAIRIQFVHIFLVDNKQLMDKIYSHYIYLPAYLKLMNVETTGRPNVHDTNLIDY